MDSDDETILSKMDEHRIGEIGSLDQSGVSTDVPLLDTSVKQEVESDDEFRSGFEGYFYEIFIEIFRKSCSNRGGVLEMPQKVYGVDILHVMAYAFIYEMPQNRT